MTDSDEEQVSSTLIQLATRVSNIDTKIGDILKAIEVVTNKIGTSIDIQKKYITSLIDKKNKKADRNNDRDSDYDSDVDSEASEEDRGKCEEDFTKKEKVTFSK